MLARLSSTRWVLLLLFVIGAPRPEQIDTPAPYLERGKRDIKAICGPAEVK